MQNVAYTQQNAAKHYEICRYHVFLANLKASWCYQKCVIFTLTPLIAHTQQTRRIMGKHYWTTKMVTNKHNCVNYSMIAKALVHPNHHVRCPCDLKAKLSQLIALQWCQMKGKCLYDSIKRNLIIIFNFINNYYKQNILLIIYYCPAIDRILYRSGLETVEFVYSYAILRPRGKFIEELSYISLYPVL